jgi:flagellar basal body-associated protein FliL
MEDIVSQETPYADPEPKKRMSGWLIALIVVAALLVICCFCILMSVLLLSPVTGNVFSTLVETVEAITPVP